MNGNGYHETPYGVKKWGRWENSKLIEQISKETFDLEEVKGSEMLLKGNGNNALK